MNLASGKDIDRAGARNTIQDLHALASRFWPDALLRDGFPLLPGDAGDIGGRSQGVQARRMAVFISEMI